MHVTERSLWKSTRALLLAGMLAGLPAASTLAAGIGAAGMPPAHGQQGADTGAAAHKSAAECETDAKAQGLRGKQAKQFVKTCEGAA